MQRICFIVNPISGKGNNNLSEAYIKSLFVASDYEIEINYSEYPKHAIALAKNALLQKPAIVVACGGDGTINEVASVLVNTSVKLGIIPIGSGNGLASNLKIPNDINKALEIIKKGDTTTIDVGKINDYFFFSNTGLGIDAEIIKKYHESGKRTLVSYLKSTLKASITHKPKTLHYTIDAINHKVNPLLLFVSNSNEMGYNMSLTPKASLSDGFLDLVIVPKLNFFHKSVFGMQVLTKKTHKNKKVTHTLIKDLQVQFDEVANLLIQIDGEHLHLETNTICIKIIEKSLTIIV
jgi:YegS/Rv2252/BmrU family lipid kinase